MRTYCVRADLLAIAVVCDTLIPVKLASCPKESVKAIAREAIDSINARTAIEAWFVCTLVDAESVEGEEEKGNESDQLFNLITHPAQRPLADGITYLISQLSPVKPGTQVHV